MIRLLGAVLSTTATTKRQADMKTPETSGHGLWLYGEGNGINTLLAILLLMQRLPDNTWIRSWYPPVLEAYRCFSSLLLDSGSFFLCRVFWAGSFCFSSLCALVHCSGSVWGLRLGVQLLLSGNITASLTAFSLRGCARR